MADDSSEKKGALGDILQGLTGLLELVNRIQEGGDEGITKSGEFKTESGIKGMYGVQVKTAAGGESELDQHRNVSPKRKKEPIQHEREPIVDVFDQEDQLTVVAEFPGTSEESIETSVDGYQLELRASAKDRNYQKTLTLPYKVLPKPSKRSYVNGIFSAVFKRDLKEG